MARAQAIAASAAAERNIPIESSDDRQAKSTEAPGGNTTRAELSASQKTRAADAGDGATDSAALPERIQLIAYQLWIDRGCPIGSPEIDWMEAESICRKSQSSVTSGQGRTTL
jgi:hypothetical protein